MDTTTSAEHDKTRHKLSCTQCRSRKIKCQRTHPCENCVKSGKDCVFPSRKRMQRPRKAKNSELLSRISRLESIVGKVGEVDPEALKGLEIHGLSAAEPRPAEARQPLQPFPGRTWKHPEQAAIPSGSGLQGKEASRYLSGEFWASLCDEVEGLKIALEQSTDSDSDESIETGSPEYEDNLRTFTTPGLLGSCSSPSNAAVPPHPSPEQLACLVAAFSDNVDPIVKILHRPTAVKMLLSGPESMSPAQEALAFAMYFAAVTTLSDEKCLLQLGAPRLALCKHYQVATEQALAAADYLNNTDLESLQALTLYVAVIRSHDQSRASWILIALTLRCAQAFNLNRDGDGSRYDFYEAELRCRLFWFIVILDIRGAEDRGTEAMIATDSYNTRLPKNINDIDFGPETREPPPDRGVEPSDTTFLICMAKCSGIFLYCGHAQARLSSMVPTQTEEEIIKHAQRLEQRFVATADPSLIQSYMATNLVRLINLKLWLILQYPIHPRKTADAKSGPRWPKVSREAMLQTAVSICELQHHAASSPYAERADWWNRTYVQWHPLAVCLAELCIQTKGPLVDRAWTIVEEVYPKWKDQVADARNGPLWRPIRKLYKKAKAARAAALEPEIGRAESSVMPGLETALGSAPPVESDSALGATTSNTTTSTRTGSGAGIGADTGGSGGSSALFGVGTGATSMTSPQQMNMPQGADIGLFGFTGDPALTMPDVNFDLPLDTNSRLDMMDWGVWNDFVNDTYAEGPSSTDS